MAYGEGPQMLAWQVRVLFFTFYISQALVDMTNSWEMQSQRGEGSFWLKLEKFQALSGWAHYLRPEWDKVSWKQECGVEAAHFGSQEAKSALIFVLSP